jgi:D-3-phosphoglycerate dehydrogenase
MAPKAVYIDCLPYAAKLLGEGLRALVPELVPHMGDPDPAELRRRLAGAAAVVNGHTVMDAPLLQSCPELRTIVYLGTGASNYIDLDAAERLDIRVRTVKGYGDRSVAEHAFALMLSAARQIAAMDRDLRAGGWTALDGIELQGKTLGVIGTGAIGIELIRMAMGFGMDVMAWNRSGVPGQVPCRACELEPLLRQSDVVSLHIAQTEATIGFLDRQRLAEMKPGAILINTSRGAVIDEAALIAALTEQRLGHAALDVFATEPLPPGHPLTRLANVTLTGHAAFKTPEASRRLFSRALELLRDDLAVLAQGGALERGQPR